MASYKESQDLRNKVLTLTKNKPITTLVEITESVLASLSNANSTSLPKFEEAENDEEYGIGSLVFKNFSERRHEQGEYYSDPIVVDGHIFKLKF